MKLLGYLYEMLFGCRHKLGWPITLKGRTYQVCRECGKEFDARKWKVA